MRQSLRFFFSDSCRSCTCLHGPAPVAETFRFQERFNTLWPSSGYGMFWCVYRGFYHVRQVSCYGCMGKGLKGGRGEKGEARRRAKGALTRFGSGILKPGSHFEAPRPVSSIDA